MKAQRVVALAIVILALLSAVVLVSRPVGQPTVSGRDQVLVVRLYGGIAEAGSGLLGTDGSINPQVVARHLRSAAANPAVKAVVLRISSPGGSVAASQEIYNMIRRFEKPIVVSMGDMVASGGYYIAAAADGIVANPGTVTGSIGVITTVMNLEGLYEKLGVDVQIIKSGEHKDMFQRPLTAEERQLLQQLNDETWNQFIQAVAEGRALDPEYVRTLATGEVFTGSQALALGLVDRLGDLHEAVQFAAELAGVTDPVPVEPRSPTVWQQLMGVLPAVLTKFQDRVLINPVELINTFDSVPRVRYE